MTPSEMQRRFELYGIDRAAEVDQVRARALLDGKE
jgi:hypothetical protein